MLLGTPAAPGTGIAHRRRGSGSRAHPVTVGLRAGLTPASRLRQHPHCSPAHASEPGVTNPGLAVRMWGLRAVRGAVAWTGRTGPTAVLVGRPVRTVVRSGDGACRAWSRRRGARRGGLGGRAVVLAGMALAIACSI